MRFSSYLTATVIVIGATVVMGWIAASVGVALGNAQRDLEAISNRNECVDRELVIEGCDKHGANCAPIYMCGGE